MKNLYKNKKKISIIACLVVILAIFIPVGINKLGTNIDGKSSNKNSQNQSSNNSQSSNENSDNGEDKDVETSNENNNKNNDDKSNSNSNNSSGDKSNTSDVSSDKVSSNYKTPDSSLIIQRIKAYSGIFIEDGSDKEVENVAAIQVKNTSNQVVEYAQIELYNGNKKLVFEVSTLPANSSAVVMEKYKTDFSSSKGVTYGKTTVAYADKLEKSSNIKYTILDNNGIKVTNKSKKDIDCVRIFYKYKSEDGYYVGGITYTAKIEALKAGKSQTIYPSHYATEGGEIMMIKTYDE